MGEDRIRYVSDLTAWLLYLLILAVGTYDVIIAWRYGPRATVSHVVLRFSREYPILPFLAGVVLGHLLWTQSVNGR